MVGSAERALLPLLEGLKPSAMLNQGRVSSAQEPTWEDSALTPSMMGKILNLSMPECSHLQHGIAMGLL